MSLPSGLTTGICPSLQLSPSKINSLQVEKVGFQFPLLRHSFPQTRSPPSQIDEVSRCFSRVVAVPATDPIGCPSGFRDDLRFRTCSSSRPPPWVTESHSKPGIRKGQVSASRGLRASAHCARRRNAAGRPGAVRRRRGKSRRESPRSTGAVLWRADAHQGSRLADGRQKAGVWVPAASRPGRDADRSADRELPARRTYSLWSIDDARVRDDI